MTTETLQLPGHVQRALDDAVRAIVKIANPQAIILFGSWAEGRGQERSDIDLLVVADTDDRRDLAGRIHAAIDRAQGGHWRERLDFDVIVLTPEQWEHESKLPGLTIFRARRRGVVVHGQVA